MKITEVAAAVILKPDGRFLLGQRPEGKPYPGYWEFPGGKIEAGETPLEALVREIKEELDLTITHATPWITLTHAYTHATVRLHFFKVHDWRGVPAGLEGQAFCWQSSDVQTVAPMLPANAPLFRALSLPPIYAISNAGEIGAAAYLSQLDVALQKGLRLIQVREKNFSHDALRKFAADVIARAHAHGARVLINSDVALAHDVGADGVHLTSTQLAEIKNRPDAPLVGASTHSRAEINRAAELGCDFAVMGPVQKTPSHPDVEGIGWARFAALVLDTPLPVYALGGLRVDDRETAIKHGAHGVAMQRNMMP